MEAFQAPQKAINWAMECLQRGQEAFIRYVEDDAFAFAIESDPETGQRTKKLKQVKPIPIEIEGNFRTAILELKHSFDMSLFAAAQRLNYSRWDGNYPWSNSPTGLDGIIKKRQSKDETRLPQELIDEIIRHQPYATGPGFVGGNDLIRDVAKMANGKHTIGVAATAAVTSVNMAVIVLQAPANGRAEAFCGPWDPVKKEITVFRMTGGDDGSISHSDPDIAVDILFEFAGLISTIPAQIVIAEFAQRAQLVLEGFKAVCAKAAP